MKVSALLTSAGINIGVVVLVFSLYSILRKQPSNAVVFFTRRLASKSRRPKDNCSLDRFLPSASWVRKAWELTENEVLACGGLDAVAFYRLIIFSIRIFSIAAAVGLLLVLPVNYYGKDMAHQIFPKEELEVFTIANVGEESKWIWAHCLALHITCCSACVLLYFEYKRLTRIRLAHLSASPANPSHFAVLVRAIPWSPQESYSEMVRKFYTRYHSSSYLSHQIVYRSGTVHKLLNDAEKMCTKIDKSIDRSPKPKFSVDFKRLKNSFKKLPKESESIRGDGFRDSDLNAGNKECPAAFVFFKSRYAAVVASRVLQSSDSMLWVIDQAPEPQDVYWSSLWLPYGTLWIRKTLTLVATVSLVFVFMGPVTFVQGLTQVENLGKYSPTLKRLLSKNRNGMLQVVTGYLPSVVLTAFLYIIPPIMMILSSAEGPISRSKRKISAFCKFLYFMIWNIFFVNVLSGSIISNLSDISNPASIPTILARAVPQQAGFFTTYALTSGLASLAFEIMQPWPLLYNWFKRIILRDKDDSHYIGIRFPYHTEVTKLLLFGLLGFIYSIMAPLILPFLLVYFFLAYLVYKNQFLNVYVLKYETGGQYWPIIHNATVCSMLLTQVIALGVFGLKGSSSSSMFTVTLIGWTLLFNEYCRKRFYPMFKKSVAEILIDMDLRDERSGKLEEIHQWLPSAYCQFDSDSDDPSKQEDQGEIKDTVDGTSVIQSEDSWRYDLEGEPSRK